jgi:hypothetical protein
LKSLEVVVVRENGERERGRTRRAPEKARSKCFKKWVGGVYLPVGVWLLGAGTDRKAGFSDYEPTGEQGEKRRRCTVYRTLVETIR